MATEEKDINNSTDDEKIENNASVDTNQEDIDSSVEQESQASCNDEAQGDKSNSDLDALTKELQEEKDKYLRLYAEFQNYRNRTTKEKTEAYNNAISECVKQILPVIDNFERALTQECSDENYKSGMEMIFKNFMAILDKMGVKEIDALGKPFDPNIHHAIQQCENDKYESDTVCNVFQKGYMLGERLIRPAMVQVVQ
ncbi:MAG: nucleotide exchange factor GrpE [Ruminococcus sp.]|nr:nucleotide exchange factor GrpE [Ruminococcus sp.]MCD7801097.1 nucleotide exchange factor GrpE [Ruminococcus sp.]